MNRLVSWDWPGNVRELENVLENALVHSEDAVLGEELFAGLIAPGMAQLGYTEARARMLEQFERSYVGMMLRECDGSISEAARRMGLTRQGLQKMMRRLGMQRDDLKRRSR
jgi:transcriptional regulator of acetoin/glycerol metabolism